MGKCLRYLNIASENCIHDTLIVNGNFASLESLEKRDVLSVIFGEIKDIAGLGSSKSK